MANLHVQRRRADSMERGATLVEFALILPVFVVLIFGMITGGIAVSQENSVRNAVREASRFAAVTTSGAAEAAIQDPYLKKVIEQVEAAATGDLDDSVTGKEICVAFNDGSVWYSRTKKPGGTSTALAPCIASDGASGKRVQIVAKRRAEIGAIFFTVPINLASQTVTRYEL